MAEWNEARTTLGEMKEVVGRFVRERGWESAHSPKNLAMAIAIEAAELMEIYQWVSSEEAAVAHEEAELLEHVREEVADVMIYCLSLSRALNFDLAAAIEEKIAKNGVKYPAPVEQGSLE